MRKAYWGYSTKIMKNSNYTWDFCLVCHFHHFTSMIISPTFQVSRQMTRRLTMHAIHVLHTSHGQSMKDWIECECLEKSCTTKTLLSSFNANKYTIELIYCRAQTTTILAFKVRTVSIIATRIKQLPRDSPSRNHGPNAIFPTAHS